MCCAVAMAERRPRAGGSNKTAAAAAMHVHSGVGVGGSGGSLLGMAAANYISMRPKQWLVCWKAARLVGVVAWYFLTCVTS